MADQLANTTHHRLGQVSWALFEWARNPYYILIMIYIFGPYFTNDVIGDPVLGQEIWGYILSLIHIYAPTRPERS